MILPASLTIKEGKRFVFLINSGPFQREASSMSKMQVILAFPRDNNCRMRLLGESFETVSAADLSM